MAQVFLSYDRDDRDRARPVALALERAGHSVWWDLHVRGGAQFAKAIEEALEASDAVVVLWSKQSIESAWVRDEAAAGRDSGRLVPVQIDGTEPPMGFRQFQNIDFTGWKGRSRSVEFRQLLQAIDSLAANASAATSQAPVALGPSGLVRRIDRPRLIALVVIAAVLIAGAFAAWRLLDGPSSLPLVAVVAADPAAEPLARDLMVKLGTLQSAKSASMRLIDQDPGETRRADLVFEVDGDVSSSKPHSSVVLTAGENRTILWSSDFEQQAGSATDLKQQSAFTAARVLGCALEGRSTEHGRLSQPALKLYLNACALLGETFWHDTSDVIPVLQKVIEQAPRFEPAWSKLLVAETNRYQTMNAEEQREAAGNLRRRIAAARQVNADLPEAYIAEVELLPGRAFYDQVRLIDRAAKAGPDNPFVLAGRSLILLGVGRLDAAVKDARRAASLDPLSPAMRNSYLQALIYSGRTQAARSELTKAERLWPGATTIADARYRLSLAYGSVAETADALRLIQSGAVRGGRTREAFVQARLEPTQTNIDLAVQRATSAYRARPEIDTTIDLLLTLGEFDRTDELLKSLLAFDQASHVPYFVEILFRPPLADLRADRRFMRVAARFGLLDYWQRSGDWPDFCSEPDLPYDCKKEAAKLAA